MNRVLKDNVILGFLVAATLTASAVLGGSTVRLLKPTDTALAAALRGAPPKPVAAPTVPLPPGDIGKLIAGLKISVPDLAFELSPMPKLKVSSFNLPFPDLPAKGLFGNIGVDPKIDYRGDVVISVPTTAIPDVSQPAPPAVPSSGQTAPPSAAPPTEQPSSLEPNVSNCAQFSSMPNAQFCLTVPDSNGQKLCQICKQSGF